jgi:hypothetical protein
MKIVNRVFKRNGIQLLVIPITIFIITGCQWPGQQIVLDSTGNTDAPIATLKSTIITPRISINTPKPGVCVDTQYTTPMTAAQVDYLANHQFHFIYSSAGRQPDSIFSINRADTFCSPGYGEFNNPNVWKIVSGFIISLDQPDKSIYFPGNNDEFTHVYAKALFLNRDGKEYEYWLKITGYPPTQWFQLVHWGEWIAEDINQEGMQIEEIFSSEMNSDGTRSYVDARTILSQGLLQKDDQFVAIIYMGAVDRSGIYHSNFDKGLINKQFIDAIEGKGDFPIPYPSYYLEIQAILIPEKK